MATYRYREVPHHPITNTRYMSRKKSSNILVTNDKNFFTLISGHADTETSNFVSEHIFPIFQGFLASRAIQDALNETCRTLHARCKELRKRGGCTLCIVYVCESRCFVSYLGAWNVQSIDANGTWRTSDAPHHTTYDRTELNRLKSVGSSKKKFTFGSLIPDCLHKFTRTIGDVHREELLASPSYFIVDNAKYLIVTSGHFDRIEALSSSSSSTVDEKESGTNDMWCERFDRGGGNFERCFFSANKKKKLYTTDRLFDYLLLSAKKTKLLDENAATNCCGQVCLLKINTKK